MTLDDLITMLQALPESARSAQVYIEVGKEEEYGVPLSALYEDGAVMILAEREV